ncbi:nuclear transport factor 2 family protein [Lutibacter sp. HS1-25]|uniref:YybH family protein n=1 Tax=Lutibacter sp. HS1-25 TaxID=2485000 RepID=UPI0010109272|nr:nuclear transport factor 2 family protein [Lutibacter sp. HS1-25]RXP64566.1 nuclear transport factor 2 family protein [Lutibacter sp. HS1-25]
MKSTILKLTLVIVTMGLFGACTTKNEEPAAVVIDKEQIKKEIQAKEDLFAATYNDAKMEDIGYYADDAVSYSHNREPLVGKQAIIDFLAEGIDSLALKNKISFKTQDVFPSNDGAQVLEIGHYTVVDSINAIISSGNYMTLFEKRDGNYVSVREMSVSDMLVEEE